MTEQEQARMSDRLQKAEALRRSIDNLDSRIESIQEAKGIGLYWGGGSIWRLSRFDYSHTDKMVEIDVDNQTLHSAFETVKESLVNNLRAKRDELRKQYEAL